MARPIRVYLSGPITKGDRTQNFTTFCQWQKKLLEEGYAVLNPGLSMLHPDAWNLSHETWVRSDLPWVEVSDCVVRLPGDSKGADEEIECAAALGIPVFHADFDPSLRCFKCRGFDAFHRFILDVVIPRNIRIFRDAKESGKMPEAKESPVKEDKKTAGGTEAPRSFSVGDLVRVVGPRDVEDSENGPGFTSTMRDMVGRVFEVEESDRDGECYFQGFHFLPHWLEPADARKFQVGDKVRLRDPGPKPKDPWVEAMREDIGRTGVVCDFLNNPLVLFPADFGHREYSLYCRPEWLDLIEPAKEPVKEPKAKLEPDYPHAQDVVDFHPVGLAAVRWEKSSEPCDCRLCESETRNAPTKSILDEAKAAVTGDRQASYGPPDQDFARTAGMWSALFSDLLREGVRFEPFHVAQAMILLKMSRQRHQRKRDNWVDAAGYAHCGAVCDEVAKG